MSTLRYLLISMRPKQWSKNLLVYVALALSINEAWTLSNLIYVEWLFAMETVGFVLFCCVTSSEYLVNDLADLKRDQAHPRKRLRPLPSGRLPRSYAIVTAIVLPAVALPLSWMLRPGFGVVLSVYYVMMLAYTFALKHAVIMDVLTIAAGFVLRAIAGGVIIAVPISPWLYICTALAALFLGLAKRRAELVALENGSGRHRRTLEDYSLTLVDQMIAVVASSALVAYGLYTFSAPNLPPNHAMMLTIPFALYAILRYLYLIHARNEGGSPEETLLSDVPMVLDVVLWGIAAVFILIFFRLP